jgi:hypothetical protein
MRRTLAALVLCLASLMSCSGGDTPAATLAPATGSAAATGPAASLPATATAVEPDDRPSLSISSPKDGASISGNSVTVIVEVERFAVVNKIGDKNKDGEGHLHFYLDVDEIPTEPAHEATVAGGEGRYVATPATSYTWSNLRPGPHKLGAQLVQNNHTPLLPAATAEITITIGG